MSEQHSNGGNVGVIKKPYDARVADWILEKYPDQYVAVTHDGATVLAASAKGEELIKQLDAAGHDPATYFIQRIYSANSILVF